MGKSTDFLCENIILLAESPADLQASCCYCCWNEFRLYSFCRGYDAVWSV